MTYRHRQVGRVNVALTLVIAAWFAWNAVRSGAVALWIGVAIAALVLLLFSTLTVTVDDTTLRLWFGPGVWLRAIARADIESATADRSRWWEGIGVRVTTRGRLYNAETGPAVALVLRGGERLRIGTDDVPGLLAALGRPAA